MMIAGELGFEEVSMSRVAVELGVTPRWLYRHMAFRDELVAVTVGLAVERSVYERVGYGWPE